MSKRFTIKDIANMAGVSSGTVDRVIHNRGKVAPRVKARIMRVMEKMNYKPNIIARTLALNKNQEFIIFIPTPAVDAYWALVKEGIDTALNLVRHYGVVPKFFFYDYSKSRDFLKVAQNVMDSFPVAVLFAPIFAEESAKFIRTCQKHHIPVVLINNTIKDIQTLCYVGTNSYQSGVLAGRLLKNEASGNGSYIVYHTEVQTSNAEHFIAKEKGFRDYLLNANSSTALIHRVDYGAVINKISIEEYTVEVMRKCHPVSAVFVTSSKVYLVASVIKNISPNTSVLGFDLVEQNREMLDNGNVDVLLSQNPGQQGYLGIMNLVNILIFNKNVKEEQFLPLDIVLKENMKYYLDKRELVTAV